MGKKSRKIKRSMRELERLLEGLKISPPKVETKRSIRRKDRILKLCFFCHKGGHVARQCPMRMRYSFN